MKLRCKPSEKLISKFESFVERTNDLGVVYFKSCGFVDPKYFSGMVTLTTDNGTKLALLYSMNKAQICVVEGDKYYKAYTV